MNKVKGLLLLLGVGLLVFYITRSVYEPEAAEEQVSATVLLERMRPVLKLVTVEGDFNEVYTYRDAQASFDWLKQFSPFQKKAMLRVKARVSVGYDLEGLDLRVDEAGHTVTLQGMHMPEVLSIDHELDYYDLEAGTFNPFTAQDHTRMEADAKNVIKRKVAESGLFRAAADRKQEVIKVLRAMVESSGWTFVDGSATATLIKG
ncbi:MAG: DUF4230 domain-containing protein [Flavobacteriales bacterium]|nr:DUF4230 domain-containing protein [Flavobacteriales bacterium]